ncbi:hypothetical protein Cal7507_1555 [Calothrix sp. PCC 7507]|nr:hypothetical protein Cal7507_1555 [Calothrix sp. PCC 7507]
MTLMHSFIRCDFSPRQTLMNPQGKLKKIICLTFILWLLSTSFYSSAVLVSRRKAFTVLTNNSVLTDVQEMFWFHKERGGIRRTVGNSGRNISKATGTIFE